MGLLRLTSAGSEFFECFLRNVAAFIDLLLPCFAAQEFIRLLGSEIPTELLLLEFECTAFMFFMVFARMDLLFTTGESIT